MNQLSQRCVHFNGVPQERRRTVNPLRGKTEFVANKTIKVFPNGENKTEFLRRNLRGSQITKAIRTSTKRKLFRGACREIPTRIPAEVIPLYQQNQRGIPEGNPHLNFTPMYDQSGHQKEINSQVPVEIFYAEYESYVEPNRSKKGITPKHRPEKFAPAG